MTQSTFTAVESAAHEGAFGDNDLPLPTQAQREAGNYRMGRVSIHGLRIAIEQPRGSVRTGQDRNGTRWSCRMAAHYGYFIGTMGADGDPVDVFVGPAPDADTAFVINQNVAGRFDEHKVVLGAVDEEHARTLYRTSYAAGWRGLASIVSATIPQLRQWLRHGNKRRALTADQLNQQGTPSMNRVFWNRDAQPEGLSLDQVLYHVRVEDGGENLLLDSVTMDDIMEDSEGVIALDAMVLPVSLLARKMDVLKNVMERAGGAVKPLGVQISDPFKQRGVTNVAALFELSDGQTVSIYFHNPDTTPNKLAPTDDLISWKWLLNKRDITIVVAPERGADLNPREVATRIMRLAERNSAAFQRVNTKRAERMSSIQSLKGEIVELETELQKAQRELEIEHILAEERLANPAPTVPEATGFEAEVARQAPEGFTVQQVDATSATLTNEAGHTIQLDIKPIPGTDRVRLYGSAVVGGKSHDAGSIPNPGDNWDKSLRYAYEMAAEVAEREAGRLPPAAAEEEAAPMAPTLANATPEFTAWLAEKAAAFAGAEAGPARMAEAIEAAVKGEGGSIMWGADPVGTMDSAEAGEEADEDEGEDFDEEAEWEATPEEDDEEVALDGDFSGHPFRGNQYRKGSRTSGTAVAASIHAKKLSRAGSSRDIRNAHRIAGYSHVAASLAVTTGAARRYHRKMARFHAKSGGVEIALDTAEVMDGVSDMHVTAVIRNGEGVEVGMALLYQDGSAGIRDAAGNRVSAVSENVDAATDGVRAVLRAGGKVNGRREFVDAMNFLTPFLSRSQFAAMKSGGAGEESQYFYDKAVEMADTIRNMPETYGQDGKGGEAVAYLHYFRGGADWYITEKDKGGGDVENVQQQAFGLADLFGDGGETGYISIAELVENGVELDLHWTPKTINQIRGKGEKSEPEPSAEAWSLPIVSPESMVEMAQQRGIEADVYETAPYADGTAATRATLTKGDVVATIVWNAARKEYTLHFDPKPGDVDGDMQGMLSDLIDAVAAKAAPENGDGGESAGSDDELVEAGVLAAKQNEIAKLLTEDNFTMQFNGDDVLVDGELRDKIEAALGEKLVEATVPGLEGQVTLVPASQAPAAAEPEPQPEPEPAAAVETDVSRVSALRKLLPEGDIRSDDPDALEKLNAKLAYRTELGEMMRKANKLLRKGDDDGLRAMGFSDKVLTAMKTPDFVGRTGFPDYEMSNNSSEIGRLRKRIEQIESELREAAVVPAEEPAAEANSQLDADKALMQSVIDGTNADILSPSLADELEAAYLRHESDAEMAGLFEQAVNAYQAAMMNATASL